MKAPILFLIVLLAVSCRQKADGSQGEMALQGSKASSATETMQNLETAYFASGCFWCVEAIFESVKGVKEVYSGYSGGSTPDPTYTEVANGRTDHAEAVEVYYDPKIIGFPQLVEIFFGSHDPTTLNRQGPDRGAQYRSIALYKDEAQKKIITDHISQLESDKVHDRPIVTQVLPFVKFHRAEDYHQDYEQKHPDNPYVQNVSIPRLNRFKEKFRAYLKNGEH